MFIKSVLTPEKQRGEEIRITRLKLRLSQKDLAGLINNKHEKYKVKISQERISAIERGCGCYATELFAIADILSLDVKDLSFFGQQPSFRNIS